MKIFFSNDKGSKSFFLRPIFFLAILSFIVLVGACGDEEIAPSPPIPPVPTESTIAEILAALNIGTQISELENMTYTTNGASFEYEEEEPGLVNPQQVNEFTIDVAKELGNRKLILNHINFKVTFPVGFTSSGATTIINDQQGTKSGQYSVASYYFGAVAPTPLYASRIEADLKQYMMANPLELMKIYLQNNPSLAATTAGNILKIPTTIVGHDIDLSIDLETHLPISASIMESDFLHGDVAYKIEYGDWIDLDNIKYPSKITHFYNGDIVKNEAITDVKTNVTLDENTFTPEMVNTPIAYDETLGEKGIYSSQWYSRLSESGLPIDLSLTTAFVAGADWVPFGIADQTIGPKVKIIGRPDLLYWSVAIETTEGVLIVDAPLHQEWCRAIINTVKSEAGFPESEIIGVIPTHSHYDHYGGIREMAAEAGKIYVNETEEVHLRSILSAAHTLVPDALAMGTKDIEIEGVEGITVLDSGAVEIHNVNMGNSGGNPHSDNMLIVYVPAYELVIQADLFNAGGLFALYAGAGAFPLEEATKSTWNVRAKFLLDYINNKELTVSRIVGLHGGIATLPQLNLVAE